MMGSTPALPTPDDVLAAAEVLRGVVNRTPVFRSRTLDALAGAEVLLKCEPFQRTGSFKFRGAFHAVAGMSPPERNRGVLAYSSGNHAQAVALAAHLHGVAATVVMPVDAPAVKRTATEAYGATVVTYDPAEESREEVAAGIQQRTGAVLVPPFDHAAVIAGQGTAALELIEEAETIDAIVAPCGGGGLLSGTALAAAGRLPGCRVHGVEPDGADDATRSFHEGVLHRVDRPRTIADGLRTPSLGALTFPLVRTLAAGMWTVSEEEIVRAMHFLWSRCKLVVEPSGAVGVARLLGGWPELRGGRIGVILSGGNVDLERAVHMLARSPLGSTGVETQREPRGSEHA